MANWTARCAVYFLIRQSVADIFRQGLWIKVVIVSPVIKYAGH
jgi:hypothetical protein